MADENINVALRLRGARQYHAELAAASRETRDFGDEHDRASKQVKRHGRELNVLQRIIGLVKPAALIAGVGLLAQVASAGAAGIAALAAGLAPLVGVVGTLPGLGLGAAQGMGVLKLAFLGVGDAVGGLNSQLDPKKLAALTPEAQRFARTLDAMKGPLRALQRSVQGALFGPLTAGLRSARPLLGALRGPLTGTAAALGDVGRRLGALVGSRGFLRDLRGQATFTNRLIPILGTAALHLANGLRHVMVAARPLTAWMVRLAASWAAGVGSAARAGRQTGALAGFFEQTRRVLSRVLSIAGSLGVALWNVLRAGRGLGGDLLGALDRSAAAFRTWTESARGRNAIVQFFRNARGPIFETAKLVRDLVGAFLRVGNRTSVGPLIAQLRGLVPVLEGVVSSTTAAFGPAMISAISTLAQAFAPLAGSSGPLVLVVKTMEAFGKALLFLERHVPGFSAVLTTAVGAFAALKAVGMMSFASSMFGAGRGVEVLSAAMTRFTATTLGTRLGLAALTVQEKAAAAGQWLLNAAMSANPIVLAVAAIVALGVAFVIAYRKVGWFRNAVNAVFGWIRTHWPLLLAILTGPIGLATLFIVRHFHQIVSFVRSLPGKIRSAASGMWDGLKSAFRSAINWILRKWNGIHLSLPKVDLGPLGHVGGGTLRMPQVPLLATGGLVRGVGSWISGEAGPELNTSLPGGGVRVQPLSGPRLAAPRMAAPRLAAAGAGGRPIVIHNHTTVELDRRKVGESMNRVVADARARA